MGVVVPLERQPCSGWVARAGNGRLGIKKLAQEDEKTYERRSISGLLRRLETRCRGACRCHTQKESVWERSLGGLKF